MELNYDVVVIGGGAAGMAAAKSASAYGAKTLLLEREEKLGGILNQCIHNGFGLKIFNEELTGPEYARRLENELKSTNVKILTSTFVSNIKGDLIFFTNALGQKFVKTKSIVLATGSHERTAGNISLPGNRPSGLYTAGFVQKMINGYGMLPGKEAVILGSGDIGLIMARRLTLSGIKVKAVLEIMPESSGLVRNIRQCLEDFNIPLLLSHTVTEVIGKDRITSIKYAQVDEKLNPIMETEKTFTCDTLLLSVGLMPEIELIKDKVLMVNQTKSAKVDDLRQTSKRGVFACGNALQIHDLADNATEEGIIAGRSAASFALSPYATKRRFDINFSEDFSYALPHCFREAHDNFAINFRVRKKLSNVTIGVYCGKELLAKRFFAKILPSTLESIQIASGKHSKEMQLQILEVGK